MTASSSVIGAQVTLGTFTVSLFRLLVVDLFNFSFLRLLHLALHTPGTSWMMFIDNEGVSDSQVWKLFLCPATAVTLEMVYDSSPAVIFLPDLTTLLHCFYQWLYTVEKSEAILIFFTCYPLKGACFHPFPWTVSGILNYDNLCPKLLKLICTFHFPFLSCLLIRNLLFRCWAGFLHLFFSCCFLGGWLEELVSWLQHLAMSLWMEWRRPFSTKVMCHLVLFFLQIVLVSHLTSWSGHCVLCWRFSLDICYSLLFLMCSDLQSFWEAVPMGGACCLKPLPK